MQYSPAICAVVVSACASGPDNRPPTLDYIVEAILVPYCGRGGCHSTETAAHHLVFDTIDAAIAAMKTKQRHNQQMVVPGSPTTSRLVTVLTEPGRVMPLDVPLPQADIDLITTWVANGADGFQP